MSSVSAQSLVVPLKSTGTRALLKPIGSSTAIARLVSQTQVSVGDSLSFALTESARTSAGVFDGEKLLRTLWSGVTYPAGTHSVKQAWDWKDDNGNAVAENQAYTLKIIANNIQYDVIGTVGNTSKLKSGPTIYHSGEFFTGMTIVDGFAYVAVGYCEGRGGHMKFALNDPQTRILLSIWPNHGQSARYVSHDSGKVYYCGQFNDGTNGIVAVNRGSDTEAPLAKGAQKFVSGSPLGTTYQSAVVTGTGLIEGFSVQRTGDFYAVAIPESNVVRTYNKTTGNDQEFTIPSARDIFFSEDNNFIWVTSATNTVAKYSINSSGVINTTPVLTLAGLVNPDGISIDPSTGKVAVLDKHPKHQIRFFNPDSGVEGVALGQEGGYSTSSEVANDKFWFVNTKKLDTNTPGWGSAVAWLAYQEDGKIWVGDVGNLRAQLFDSNLVFQDYVQFIGFHYTTQTDLNDPKRLFIFYLEFEVDYTKPLQHGNGSWKLKRNWAAGVPAISLDDKYWRMRDVVTLSNGRTYCMHRNGATLVLCELVTGGILRNTGITFPNLNHVLNSDGSVSILTWGGIGQSSVYSKRALTGFSNNNPVYANAEPELTTPVIIVHDPLIVFIRRNKLTENGLIATFNIGTYQTNPIRNNGFHLGALRNNQWVWKASPSTLFNYVGAYPMGDYDIGNGINYGGNVMQCVGKHIFWGFNGEGWKNEQTHMTAHFHQSGLLLGQYGVVLPDVSWIEEAPFGAAGNAINSSWAQVGDDIYQANCDEFLRGGSMMTRIYTLASSKEYNIAITKAKTAMPVKAGIDLMAGLPFSGAVADGTAGWSRTPTTDVVQSTDVSGVVKYRWGVVTNKTTYKQADRDLWIEFRPSSASQSGDVFRDLGTNVGINWKIEGQLTYPEGSELGENWISVLDDTGKEIFRFSRDDPSGIMTLKANNTTVRAEDAKSFARYASKPQLFRIVGQSNSTITVTYGDSLPVTVAVFQSGAVAGNPKTLRFHCGSPGSTRGHLINPINFRFDTF
ncbi:hypothetical protein [Spirosoma sp.]|uniref:hypothetical protein n=1 Tax=Spirosoma sp. TaxID=1899569 RepID=UPI003B3AD7B1